MEEQVKCDKATLQTRRVWQKKDLISLVRTVHIHQNIYPYWKISWGLTLSQLYNFFRHTWSNAQMFLNKTIFWFPYMISKLYKHLIAKRGKESGFPKTDAWCLDSSLTYFLLNIILLILLRVKWKRWSLSTTGFPDNVQRRDKNARISSTRMYW